MLCVSKHSCMCLHTCGGVFCCELFFVQTYTLALTQTDTDTDTCPNTMSKHHVITNGTSNTLFHTIYSEIEPPIRALTPRLKKTPHTVNSHWVNTISHTKQHITQHTLTHTMQLTCTHHSTHHVDTHHAAHVYASLNT